MYVFEGVDNVKSVVIGRHKFDTLGDVLHRISPEYFQNMFSSDILNGRSNITFPAGVP